MGDVIFRLLLAAGLLSCLGLPAAEKNPTTNLPEVMGVVLKPQRDFLDKVQAKFGKAKAETSGDAARAATKICYSFSEGGKLSFGAGETDAFARLDDGRWKGSAIYPGSPDGQTYGPCAPLKGKAPAFWNGLRPGLKKKEVRVMLRHSKVMVDDKERLAVYWSLPGKDLGVNVKIHFVDGTTSDVEVNVGD